ncbi:hypothetical protein [Comamonas thiooxydans]|uniref:hypothetical protein n=1 Tax=Comamonas thiooxydans TaxID=363952 RepID=UPI00311F463D
MGVAELPVHEIPALNGNNAPVHAEESWDELQVIGQVPADMNGLYVRNGPNSFLSRLGGITHMTATACCMRFVLKKAAPHIAING